MNRQPFGLGLLAHHGQHLGRQIHGQAGQARAHQRHECPAAAAAEIDHQSRRLEMLGQDRLVEVEQAVERVVLVVVPGDVLRLHVVPQSARDTGGKQPFGTMSRHASSREEQETEQPDPIPAGDGPDYSWQGCWHVGRRRWECKRTTRRQPANDGPGERPA